MRISRRVALAGSLAGLAGASLGSGRLAAKPLPSRKVEPIRVRSFPIPCFEPGNPENKHFGMLEYRSGLELQSDFAGFGGLSSLRYDATGDKLLSLSDAGMWLSARISREGNQLTGLTEAQMAPILGPGGVPLADIGAGDTESIALDGNGNAWVGVEDVNRIYRFSTFGRDGLRAEGQTIGVPEGIRNLRGSRSLESLAIFPKGSPFAGRLLAIAERAIIGTDNMPAFILGGSEPLNMTIRRTNDFDVTDCDFLPDGSLLILERWFSPFKGMGLRVRRIDPQTIKAGAVLDGPIVISADTHYQIDNYEGISVFRNRDGEIMIALISDDNFLLFQRTLLVEFAYKP